MIDKQVQYHGKGQTSNSLKTYIKTAINGKVLDIAQSQTIFGAHPGQLIIWPYHGELNQQFQLIQTGQVYQLKSMKTGKFLDVYQCSKNPGAAIVQWEANQGNNQKWKLKPTGGQNEFYIQSVDSGLVLDVNGSNGGSGNKVIQWKFHGEIGQKWILQPF